MGKMESSAAQGPYPPGDLKGEDQVSAQMKSNILKELAFNSKIFAL